MDEILFTKPRNFFPDFSAKLNKKKKIWGFYVIVLFIIYGVYIGLEDRDYILVFVAIICFPYFIHTIVRYNKLNRNRIILEFSQDGLWLPVNELFIPAQRFYHAFPALRKNRSRYVTTNINDIGLMIKVTRQEYKSLKIRSFLNLALNMGHGEKISENIFQVIIHVPFTIGKTDDIGLNISKIELIEKINSIKGEEAYVLATDKSQYRGYI